MTRNSRARDPGRADHHDVVIIGGGPAGLATALALRGPAGTGAAGADAARPSVAVVEQSAPPARKIGETLQPHCRPVLEHLGAWPSFAADRHLESRGTCSSWGGEELGYNDFLFHPYGRGWHLDRVRFEGTLAREARARGVRLLTETRLMDFRRGASGWSLTLARPGEAAHTLDAGFLVDATGRRAGIARRLGAEKVLFDRLCGAFVFFAVDQDGPRPDTFTLVEARERGWWYSAALPGGELVVGYLTDADLVRGEQLKQDRRWHSLLRETTHTRRRVAAARAVTLPVVTPAESHVLEPALGPGWIAVGDAASTFDPLSSQGILKALESGIEAARAIRGQLSGDSAATSGYERSVHAEFESYLRTRQRYYGMEERWPHEAFWSRRHQRVTLDPMLRLRSGGATPAVRRGLHLPAAELLRLCRICAQPRSAHELVAAFRAESRRAYSDLRIILAIQHLLEIEALAPAGADAGPGVEES